MSESISRRFRLDGKVAIVTGASKGIGASIARGLAEFGARVVLCSRKQESVDQMAARLREQGLEAIGVACHVGRSDQLKNLVQKALDHYGRIDVLVNNAATNPVYGPLLEVNRALFDKIMEINVWACLELANLCHPHMKAQGGGSIINIASVEGLKPSWGLGVYSISKAALLMLTQNLAKEWGPDGIRVNAICPGLIQTHFSAALWQNESLLKQIEKHLPSGRVAQPEEIAGLAVLLAGDAASYCTGGIYSADGGHLIAG